MDPPRPTPARRRSARLCETEWDEWRFEALAPGALGAGGFPRPTASMKAQSSRTLVPSSRWTGADLPAACPPANAASCAAPARRRSGWAPSHRASTGQRTLSSTLVRPTPGPLGRPRRERRARRSPVQAFHRVALPALKAAGARAHAGPDASRAARRAPTTASHTAIAPTPISAASIPRYEEASPGALTIEAAIAEAGDERRARNSISCAGGRLTNMPGARGDRINRARDLARHV